MTVEKSPRSECALYHVYGRVVTDGTASPIDSAPTFSLSLWVRTIAATDVPEAMRHDGAEMARGRDKERRAALPLNGAVRPRDVVRARRFARAIIPRTRVENSFTRARLEVPACDQTRTRTSFLAVALDSREDVKSLA